MLSQIGSLLIQTVFGVFVYALLLRFYMQAFRAPFRNPVGQFVAALTDWIVRPARRAIPGLFGLDLASILIAWLAEPPFLRGLPALHPADRQYRPLAAFRAAHRADPADPDRQPRAFRAGSVLS